MLFFRPAWIEPTVTTATSRGSTSRETIVCRRMTVAAAMTTGSIVACGREPWPPRPRSVTVSPSEAAICVPGRTPIVPAGSGVRCWPSTMSGRGKRSSTPSAIIAWAPAPYSSAGWKTATTVPDQSSVVARSRSSAPRSAVMCMSCPHACMTGTSCPGRVDAPRGRRVGEAGALLDRKAVHVGAEPDHRPLAVRDRGGDARLAETLHELQAELGELLRDDPRGARLLERELRMPVQVGVERLEVDRHAVEPTDGGGGGGGGGPRPSGRVPRRRAAHDELEREVGSHLPDALAGLVELGQDRLGRTLALPQRELVDRRQAEERARARVRRCRRRRGRPAPGSRARVPPAERRWPSRRMRRRSRRGWRRAARAAASRRGTRPRS